MYVTKLSSGFCIRQREFDSIEHNFEWVFAAAALGLKE